LQAEAGIFLHSWNRHPYSIQNWNSVHLMLVFLPSYPQITSPSMWYIYIFLYISHIFIYINPLKMKHICFI
jgi:hypothetical protein